MCASFAVMQQHHRHACVGVNTRGLHVWMCTILTSVIYFSSVLVSRMDEKEEELRLRQIVRDYLDVSTVAIFFDSSSS